MWNPLDSTYRTTPANSRWAISDHLSLRLCQNCVALSENILKYAIIRDHLINLNAQKLLYVRIGFFKVWIRRFFSLIKVDAGTVALLLIMHGYLLNLFNYMISLDVESDVSNVSCVIDELDVFLTFTTSVSFVSTDPSTLRISFL